MCPQLRMLLLSHFREIFKHDTAAIKRGEKVYPYEVRGEKVLSYVVKYDHACLYLHFLLFKCFLVHYCFQQRMLVEERIRESAEALRSQHIARLAHCRSLTESAQVVFPLHFSIPRRSHLVLLDLHSTFSILHQASLACCSGIFRWVCVCSLEAPAREIKS